LNHDFSFVDGSPGFDNNVWKTILITILVQSTASEPVFLAWQS
jgi:hypothetical protein